MGTCSPHGKVPTFVDYMPNLKLVPPASPPADPQLNAEFGEFCADLDSRLGRMPDWLSALALLKMQSDHISATIAIGALAVTLASKSIDRTKPAA